MNQNKKLQKLSRGIISLQDQENLENERSKNEKILRRLRKHPHSIKTEFEWYLKMNNDAKLEVIFNDEFIIKISYEQGENFKDTPLEKIFNYETLSSIQEEETITETVDIPIDDLLPILLELKLIQ